MHFLWIASRSRRSIYVCIFDLQIKHSSQTNSNKQKKLKKNRKVSTQKVTQKFCIIIRSLEVVAETRELKSVQQMKKVQINLRLVEKTNTEIKSSWVVV